MNAAQEADWPRLAKARCRPGQPLALVKPALRHSGRSSVGLAFPNPNPNPNLLSLTLTLTLTFVVDTGADRCRVAVHDERLQDAGRRYRDTLGGPNSNSDPNRNPNPYIEIPSVRGGGLG